MKNTITALTLAIVLLFGTTFATAGIIVSDRSEKPNTCTSDDKNGIIVLEAQGAIIVFGALGGIIVFGAQGGIIVFGKEKVKPCTEKNGIIVSD